MERYHEQRRRHHEWRRQKKHHGRDISSRQPPVKASMPHPKTSKSSGPLPNHHWFHQYSPFPNVVATNTNLNSNHPPKSRSYLEEYTAIIPRLPVESPKTPPPSSTAFLRRRGSGSTGSSSEPPISPPNPLRLASTTTPRRLPRPNPTYPHPVCSLRSADLLQPLSVECLGDPRFKVFKVKLPGSLVHGPLDALVAAAEAHVERNLPNGWRTNLFSLTKCDVACKDIRGSATFVDPIVAYLSLAMRALYGRQRQITLDRNQPHILKYSAEAGHTGGELCPPVLFASFMTCDCLFQYLVIWKRDRGF